MNNETIGISAEVGIADAFNVPVNPLYRNRADSNLVNIIKREARSIFKKEGIPFPIEHIAEGQNPVDFLLEDNSTLSLKTNKGRLGKVAPQVIGQPTSTTYFEFFEDKMEFILPDSYDGKRRLFKEMSINNIDTVIEHYWDNLFECDHLLYFYEANSYSSNHQIRYVYLSKPSFRPDWKKEKFRFTQTVDSWNESCTLKYIAKNGDPISIGEFQAHRNRDCLKFRFIMEGLMYLIDSGSI